MHEVQVRIRVGGQGFCRVSLGEGIAIWFGCDDADALHDHLVKHGTEIVFPPKDGPFGRYFAFRDPFGYTITPHTVAHS